MEAKTSLLETLNKVFAWQRSLEEKRRQKDNTIQAGILKTAKLVDEELAAARTEIQNLEKELKVAQSVLGDAFYLDTEEQNLVRALINESSYVPRKFSIQLMSYLNLKLGIAHKNRAEKAG